MKVEWEGPDTDGRELITAEPVLEIPENADAQIGLDLQNASPDASVALHGLPADTIVMSGEVSVVSDGGPVDLSGLDMTDLEIAPPPGYTGQINGQIVVEDIAFNGANVTSATDFAITVGDDTKTSFDEMLIVDGVSSNEAGSEAGNDQVMPAPDEANDTDPLEEPPMETMSYDGADVAFESYERVDW